MADSPTTATTTAADAAIRQVLAAESAAREAVAAASAEVLQIGERARADARARSERVERRIRRIAAAFEVERARRLAAIEAEAAALDSAPWPAAGEDRAVQAAVAGLVLELVAALPAQEPPR